MCPPEAAVPTHQPGLEVRGVLDRWLAGNGLSDGQWWDAGVAWSRASWGRSSLNSSVSAVRNQRLRRLHLTDDKVLSGVRSDND